jgi:hypothetical protein
MVQKTKKRYNEELSSHFLPSIIFVVHRTLKSILKKQQGKGAFVNVIATRGFEDLENHSLLATRSKGKNID